MVTLTQRSLDKAMRGLLQQDNEACNAAIAAHDEIDRLEVIFGQYGTDVLMRFQPVAKDLRLIVSAMTLCGDIERIADQAVNIVRKVRKLEPDRIAIYRVRLSNMFSEAVSLLSDSVKAYQEGDLPLAHSIKERDRRLDALNTVTTNIATTEIAEDPKHLAIILIERHLERVCNHAKNAIYAVSDGDVRHASRHQQRLLPLP